MDKKSSFLIFLVIIAVLTLVIAALVTFILLVGINKPAVAVEAGGAASVVAVSVEPPDEASLATLVLLESGKPINLKTEDPSKPAFALVEMSVKYFIKVDGVKDVLSKMDLNKANLQEIVTTYFMAMSVGEFSSFETKARVKEELKKELNNYLLTTIPNEKDRRKAGEIIYDVVFSAWNYQ